MKNKVFILALLLLMIASVGVWAQNLPAAPGAYDSSIWTSPQSTTTEGRYRSNADDFMRPDSYTNVKFDKWFGFVAFLAGKDNEGYNNNTALATLGFATKVNDLYIGGLYNGNFWANMPMNNYTEMEATPNGGSKGNYDVYGTPDVDGSKTLNNAALIFGFANMGVRLTYRTNFILFDKSDIAVGNESASQLYKNYHAERGYIAPQIAWAMTKNLLENGIKPYVTLDLVFQRDYTKTETAGGNSGENILRSANHFDPAFGFGLNGYTLLNKDGFRLSADLDYVLGFQIYDNDYSYLDGTTYKTGKIQGTYLPGEGYVERFLVSNLITPSLSGQWGKDKLALKFKLNLPLAFYNYEGNLMDLNSNNDLIHKGASSKTDMFSFRPDVRLSLQYKIIPDRLMLNAGARIQATAIVAETVTQELYDDDGKKVSTKRIHENNSAHAGQPYPANGNTNANFTSRFSIGATFNFTENAWVEATTGVTDTWGGNGRGDDGAINVFDPNRGLFSFGSIMVALKF